MYKEKLSTLLIEQSSDLIWMIDPNFNLIYANAAYLELMKNVTGTEKKLNEPVFVEGFGKGYIDKWKAYYSRSIGGENFEIEEHFYHPESNEVQYSQIVFKPLFDENKVIIAISCQSRDVTRLVKLRSEANQLMDASLDTFCTINEAGNFVFVSEAATKHWGYTPQELIGKPYVSFIIEEDIPKTNDIANTILNGEEIKLFVNRYKRKDGAVAYNLWSARWDNEAKLMYCVARDAKEKIEQENLLQQSEQRFKALVQEGADMINIIDVEGRYSYTSPTTTGILGITPEEFQGRTIFDLIHPDDIERSAGYMQRISTENKVIVEPFRLRDGNNEWRWIETVLTNMMDNPAVAGIVANSRDITDKVEEQHRLKLLESVITNTNDAVLITEAEPLDEPGPRIIYVNDAFTKMTGYTAEEVIGKSPRILQGPKTDKAELARLSKALRNWQPCEITTINYKKNGDEFWINLSVSPVADKNGWYTHWIAIERDVTEQKTKELENELVVQISSTFNLVNDFEKATKKLCEIIGLYGKLDWVELWTPNLEKTEIRLISHHVITPEDEVFYTYHYNDNTFPKNEGLIGKVWASGKQILWDDVTKRKEFIRAEAAKKIGLKSVLGIPLIFNNEVLGVLTVGVKSNSGDLKKYTRIFERLEKFIGSELQRKTLENELSILFDTIPDIISVGDFQGRFLRINKPGCELLGYSEKEILQKGFEEFIHPEDLNICYEEIQQLQNGKDTFGFEVRFITKSGEILWLSWYCKARIKEGLIYCTAKNITEEKKLRELNTITSKMARIGSWEVDLIKNKILWTEMVHQLHETDSQNFVPDLTKGINFYREDFRPMVTEAVNQCIQLGTPFDFEAVIVTVTGKDLWIRAIGKAEISDGKCIRIYGSFQDINEKKLAEGQMVSLLSERNNILESIGDAFFTVDKNWIVTYWNKEAEKALSTKRSEIVGKNLWDKYADTIDLEFYKQYHKAMETGENVSFEEYYPTSNMWVEVSAYPSKEGLSVYFKDITQRKNANAAIAKSEEKRRLIMNGALDAIITIDTNERITFWNAQAEVIFGRKAEEVMGKPLSETIIPEQFRKYHVEGLKNYLQTGEGKALNILLELSAIRKNGEEFPIELTVIPIKQGGEEFFCAFIRDITQRKKAEIEILKAFDEKKRILERITEAFVSLDTNWCYTYMNKAAGLIFNRDTEKIIGKHIWTEFPEGLNQPFHHAYEKALATQEYIYLEEYYKPYDRWFENHIYPSKDGISIFFRDVTERKRSEEILKKANERFEKVTQATSDAIWDWDILNDSYYRSQNIEKYFGKQASTQLKTKDFWTDAFHAGDIEEVKSSLTIALQDPKVNLWESEYKIYGESKNIIYVMDRGLIIRDNMGKAIRMIGAMTDITKSKTQEQELLLLNESLQSYAKKLERSNEELEQFAYVSSHDLQEPLRMISSFMDMLKRKYANQLDEKALQYINFATDGAKRMKQIILDLLEYSKAGRPIEAIEMVNLNELINDYKELRRKIISEKSATISTPDLPVIYSYKAAITQVLHSLLDNAMKYSKDKIAPHIEVSVKENKDEWRFAIKDNGIGIEPEFFDKIFVIFQRLHGREKFEGTGIGLSVAKRHVELLGGKIWLESATDEGSTFYFTILK